MQPLIRKVQRQLGQLPLRVAVRLPSGRRLGPDGAALTLLFTRWEDIASLAAGQLGHLAEAFVEGFVAVDGSMRDLMVIAARLLPGHPAGPDTRWWRALFRHARSLTAHSMDRDAAQVRFHYDVSDDFYALWLDPRRVYSCAYFPALEMALAPAQEAKLDLVCRKLMLGPGDRFLDMGAGWGGLLVWAAEHYGVNATGITLSRNQHAYMETLIRTRGLAGQVTALLCDYRRLDTSVPFDRIASIGMFEHVGEAHMPAYFSKVRQLLRPGGVVLNHGITAGHTAGDPLGAGMGDFIEKYIFPGGELLHVSRVL